MAKKKAEVLSQDEELIRLGCLSTLRATLQHRGGSSAKFDAGLEGYDTAVNDYVWEVINENDFIQNYLRRYTLPRLNTMLNSAMQEGIDTVSLSIPVGRNFYARTMILDGNQEPYPGEDHVLIQLLNPHHQQLLRWTRRGAKSWFMKILMTYMAIFHPDYYSLYTCQSWDVSKEHFHIVSQWFGRNPLMFKFSGGELNHKLNQKWSDSDLYLMNESRMSCRSATLSRKLSGKSPNGLFEDEKALYPRSAISEELSIMKVGQPDLANRLHVIASAPAGDGTLFEKMCHDPEVLRYWDLSVLPMCDGFEMVDGKPVFRNINIPRVNQQVLEEQWFTLGRDRFMEQYMLITMCIENRAIPEDVVEAFFDRTGTIVPRMSSDKPCYISYDLGKSSSHRSIIEIGEQQEDEKLNIIRNIRFKPGHPIRTRSRGGDTGVIETVVNLADAYPVMGVIGDATGMGADEPFNELKQMLYEKGVPTNNVVGYKWGHKSKEFMGKAELWFNLVLPLLERGMIRSYYHEDFHWEMTVWQASPSQTGATTLLKPEKQTYSDDMITAMMQMAFLAFRHKRATPLPSRTGPALYGSGPKERTSRNISIGRKRREPRWRKERF
jgi:hypothetical protein